MPIPVLLLSIPGLRRGDLRHMPQLSALTARCEPRTLTPTFPAVTWPAQASLLTGCFPREHGIVANGVFHRPSGKVEMWTGGNDWIQRPQIWDRLSQAGRGLTTAAWFPMLAKRSAADYWCLPAPKHHPDGTETTWCATRPESLYEELAAELGPFPLHHFWGPLAALPSSKWIADAAARVARRFRPDFFYVYLPHLDYAAQKCGPDSPEALKAVADLDALLGSLSNEVSAAYDGRLQWWIASEYTIGAVDHVCFPNRLLRDAGWLRVQSTDQGEWLDFQNSTAWAMVDHQMAHVFIQPDQPVAPIARLLAAQPGIAQVLDRAQQATWNIDHPRAGDLVLVSQPNSWQAYYWWLDDARAPPWARSVDIHRKPGYDPVELHVDLATRSIPLRAELVRGSHGSIDTAAGEGVLLCSDPLPSAGQTLADREVAGLVLRHFQVPPH